MFMVTWREKTSMSVMISLPSPFMPLLPSQFSIVCFSAFAPHREHSMRMFICPTLLCVRWRNLKWHVAAWFFNQRAFGTVLADAQGLNPQRLVSQSEAAFCPLDTPTVIEFALCQIGNPDFRWEKDLRELGHFPWWLKTLPLVERIGSFSLFGGGMVLQAK